jgi:hypothetical protein
LIHHGVKSSIEIKTVEKTNSPTIAIWNTRSAVIALAPQIDRGGLLLVGMQLALLGLVLPNQDGNSVQGELVGGMRRECFAVHYLLIQLSAFFALKRSHSVKGGSANSSLCHRRPVQLSVI